MTRTLAAGLAAIALTLGAARVSSAKCYKFSDAGGDVGVCVGKGSDSSADRQKAKAILQKALGKDPGNVSSSSSSCHSNAGKCYDENGNASSDLSGY